MMAKLYWRVKTNGKWEFVSADRYPNAPNFCEHEIFLQENKEEEE